MPTLGFYSNQCGRKKLAARLVAISEDKYKGLEFGQALLAVNSALENINTDDINHYWDKWAAVSDALRLTDDERERARLELLFTYLGTILEEMRELGFR